MLPFIFSISIKTNSIHFFPMRNNFPFNQKKESDKKTSTIEVGVQKSFNKLMKIQILLKRKKVNVQMIEKILDDLNQFMLSTNAIWRRVPSAQDDESFFTFRLFNRQKCISSENRARLGIRISCDAHTKGVKPQFFRPWE